jgi:hypothetical protein
MLWDGIELSRADFFHFSTALVVLGFLIIDVSRSHSDTSDSVGLLWTSWPARRRDIYLTTHNTHTRQTSMPLAGFEPAILASKRPQILALDSLATGIGCLQATPLYV